MKTDITDTSTRLGQTRLSPSTIFNVLSDDRRRYTLHYLTRKVGAVPLGEVAEQIAIWEDDPSRDRFERIVTGLYHIHIPRLAEEGIVRYDPELETIELRPPADQLRPYLDLSFSDTGC